MIYGENENVKVISIVETVKGFLDQINVFVILNEYNEDEMKEQANDFLVERAKENGFEVTEEYSEEDLIKDGHYEAENGYMIMFQVSTVHI